MLAVSRPQFCSVRHRACANQRVRNLDPMAPSVLPQVDARLTSRFLVDWNTSQRPEKIVQSVILTRPGACPEFSYTDRGIQDTSVGVTQVYPFGDDLRILAAGDFN